MEKWCLLLYTCKTAHGPRVTGAISVRMLRWAGLRLIYLCVNQCWDLSSSGRIPIRCDDIGGKKGWKWRDREGLMRGETHWARCGGWSCQEELPGH